MNIKIMSSKSWYDVLLENCVTHAADSDGVRLLKPCRTETTNPGNNWVNTWKAATTPGLPSELKSFLWRMLHNILPTRTRLFRMKMPNILSPNCILCDDDNPDTTLHALFNCSKSKQAADYLLKGLRLFDPDITAEKVIFQDFSGSENDLPLIFVSASVMNQIWTSRKEGKTCDIISVRANLESSIQILRKSRFSPAATKLETLISTLVI